MHEGKPVQMNTEVTSFIALPQLETVYIEDGITEVMGLRTNPNLKSVRLPNTLKTIANGTFRDCTALEYIILPSSLETIGNEAFRGSALKSLTIPYGVTSIGNSAFRDCASLTTAIVPETVATVGTSIFDLRSSVTSKLTLQLTVYDINDYLWNNNIFYLEQRGGKAIVSVIPTEEQEYEPAVYRILLVFVTEINAIFPHFIGEDIHVQYVMSEEERQTALTLAVELEETLNGWFTDHFVSFEVDAFFTTVPLTDISIFSHDHYTTAQGITTAEGYTIDVTRIPEYRELFGTHKFHPDYQYNCTIGFMTFGAEHEHRRNIYQAHAIDSLAFVNFGMPKENLLYVTTHELVHCVENFRAPQGYPNRPRPYGNNQHLFHNTMEYYRLFVNPNLQGMTSIEYGLETSRRYLLKEAEYYGEMVGIPESYWNWVLTTR